MVKYLMVCLMVWVVSQLAYDVNKLGGQGVKTLPNNKQ